jgi:hypothetical protein
MKVGDIALTESGTLLNSYLEYYGFTAPSIDAMNHYFNHRLPAQIMSRTITHPDGGTIRFENVALLSPSELNVAGDPGAKTHGLKGKALTPQQARLENATYSVSLYVDFVQYNKENMDEVRLAVFETPAVSPEAQVIPTPWLELLQEGYRGKSPSSVPTPLPVPKTLVRKKIGLCCLERIDPPEMPPLPPPRPLEPPIPPAPARTYHRQRRHRTQALVPF